MNRNRPDRAWRTDSAVDRVLARARFILAIALTATAAGLLFSHAITAAMAPLLGALR